jgi:hypothetical protein
MTIPHPSEFVVKLDVDEQPIEGGAFVPMLCGYPAYRLTNEAFVVRSYVSLRPGLELQDGERRLSVVAVSHPDDNPRYMKLDCEPK